MLKRINWKAILFGFIWLVSLSGLVVLMSFVNAKKNEVRCTDLKVLIPGSGNLVERTEVDKILLENQGPLVGRLLEKINIQQLEKALRSNPFIENARVYADMNGVISVQVSQRVPVLRILNYTNQDFYIDKNGLKMPVSPNFTVPVLVANGSIMEDFSGKVDTLKTKIARGLFATAVFIEKDSLWNSQIEQLYVNDKKEIEMIPRVGNHRIILGDADSLENKFRNLMAFYKKALPKVGWDAYKTISIKYADQIVCVKNTAADSARMDSMAANIIIDQLKKANAADSLNEKKDSTSNITH
ncbi:cell division protein FtsQ/DivIB [Hufsiella arboris]|uniref:cell division protein FtsQ/DivIB n=1 Tax=Hufsiella arboris TaxID=2695275 RepID=UPI00192807FF|nr:cell division protein FtsQ [Hufsiella arboris]